MKNLEEMWTRIGSVTKNEVITAVLKDEIELFKSRIEPHDTGHLYTTIGTLEHRIEELNNDDEDIQIILQGQMMILMVGEHG